MKTHKSETRFWLYLWIFIFGQIHIPGLSWHCISIVSHCWVAVRINTSFLFSLQVSFTNGKSRGYSLTSFDWSRSTLSKLIHSKQASTVEMFVEVWKTYWNPASQLWHLSLSNDSTTPLSAPRDKTTPSRKRTAADAHLSEHSSTPPSLRPVHIVHDTTHPEAASDSLQLDEAIEKGFIGK